MNQELICPHCGKQNDVRGVTCIAGSGWVGPFECEHCGKDFDTNVTRTVQYFFETQKHVPPKAKKKGTRR